MTSRKLLISLGLLIFTSACSHRQPLIDFSEHQKSKIASKSAYVQAEFDFWAAAYEPTFEDLEAFKMAWIQHGDAFPESKDFARLSKELSDSRNRIVLVALYITLYDLADLKSKNNGWTVYPVPADIVELSDVDQVIQMLMPVPNPWARYFMVRYTAETWLSTPSITIGNRTNRVDLPIRKHMPKTL